MKQLIRSKRTVISDGLLKGFTGWVTGERADMAEVTLACGTTVMVPWTGVQMTDTHPTSPAPRSRQEALDMLQFGSERDVFLHRQAIAQFFMYDSVISTNRQEIRQNRRIASPEEGTPVETISDRLTCPSCEKQATFAEWYKGSSDDWAVCPTCTGSIAYEEFTKKEQETARRLQIG